MNKLTANHWLAIACAIVGIIAMLAIAYMHHADWQTYTLVGLFAAAVGGDVYLVIRSVE